jgi:hypothetical protein
MPNPQEDPVLTSSRREALIVGGLFLAAMGYTVGYCALYGYGRDVESLRLIFGFPDWVFWGIVVPWGVCTLVSWLFSAVYMRDEPLVEGADESESDFDLEA